MVAQGYKIKQNILFQDNKTAINIKRTGAGRTMGTPGTLLYITSLLRTGLKSTNFPLHTVAQNIFSQIFLLNPYKEPYLQNFVK